MTSCFYDGAEYSEGSEVCQEGRLMVCRFGAWEDTKRDCSLNSPVEIPYRDLEGPAEDYFHPGPVVHGLATWYAAQDSLVWSDGGAVLQGRWAQSLAACCETLPRPGLIHKIQIKEGPVVVGSCGSGKPIAVRVVIEV